MELNCTVSLELQELITDLADRFFPFDIYLVGGAVRDLFLGKEVHDFDFATNSPLDHTEKILKGWGDAYYDPGHKYGTLCAMRGTMEIQVTQLRADTYDGVSRHPDVKPVQTIMDDLTRRDFTINAMALEWDTFNKRFRLHHVDHAAQDLQSKILDTPNNPDLLFQEDPLRMVRAARFSAQLGFDIHPRVIESMRRNHSELKRVSAERITAELDKILALRNSSIALNVLQRTDLLTFPGYDFNEEIDDIPPRYAEAKWAFLYRVGDAAERIKVHRLSNERVRNILGTLDLFGEFMAINPNWTRPLVREFMHKAGHLEELVMHLVLCHTLPREFFDLDLGLLRLGEYETLDVPLTGDDVMALLCISQGKLVGEALAHLQKMRYELGPLTYDKYAHELRLWWEGKA